MTKFVKSLSGLKKYIAYIKNKCKYIYIAGGLIGLGLLNPSATNVLSNSISSRTSPSIHRSIDKCIDDELLSHNYYEIIMCNNPPTAPTNTPLNTNRSSLPKSNSRRSATNSVDAFTTKSIRPRRSINSQSTIPYYGLHDPLNQIHGGPSSISVNSNAGSDPGAGGDSGSDPAGSIEESNKDLLNNNTKTDKSIQTDQGLYRKKKKKKRITDDVCEIDAKKKNFLHFINEKKKVENATTDSYRKFLARNFTDITKTYFKVHHQMYVEFAQRPFDIVTNIAEYAKYAKSQTFTRIEDCEKSYGHCDECRTILQVISQNLLPSGEIYRPMSNETELDYILEHVYKNIIIKFGIEVKNPIGLKALISQNTTKPNIIRMAYKIGYKVRTQLFASNMDHTIAIVNLAYLNETEIPIVMNNIMAGTGANFSNFKFNAQVGAQSCNMSWNNTSMNATLLFISNILSEDTLL